QLRLGDAMGEPRRVTRSLRPGRHINDKDSSLFAPPAAPTVAPSVPRPIEKILRRELAEKAGRERRWDARAKRQPRLQCRKASGLAVEISICNSHFIARRRAGQRDGKPPLDLLAPIAAGFSLQA